MATKTKTVCPISRDDFNEEAQPMELTMAGQPAGVSAAPLVFGTGSFGWKYEGEVTLILNGMPVTCFVGLNIVVKGSKDAQ